MNEPKLLFLKLFLRAGHRGGGPYLV